MSLADVLPVFRPRRGPNDYTAARVYRGRYQVAPCKENRWIAHDFKVLSGEAEIVPAGTVRVESLGYEITSRDLESFVILPTSATVWLWIDGAERDSPKRIALFREIDPARERVYDQIVAARVVGPGEAVSL